jgi:hypothetical protein
MNSYDPKDDEEPRIPLFDNSKKVETSRRDACTKVIKEKLKSSYELL